MRWISVLLLASFVSNVNAQQFITDSSNNFSYAVPDSFMLQNKSSDRMIYVDHGIQASLVVRVYTSKMDAESIRKFQSAADSTVEKKFFSMLPGATIIRRGVLPAHPENSLYFEIRHRTTMKSENNYLVQYIIYHRDKEINFIFRFHEKDRVRMMEKVDATVASLRLR